jgi:glycosyltransferase involved in cell wall biosynthesis
MDKILVVSKHAKTSLVDTIASAKNNQTGEEFPYRIEKEVSVVLEKSPKVEPEEINGFELQFDNNFLVVSQMGPRKNFENTIKWFTEEFIDQEVGLVVKTNIRSNCLMDYDATNSFLKQVLSKYPDRKCKVYLLHGDLSSSQMTGLYNNSKISALINISHGEGFGLPMFEAAREGLPVITIGWSGQLDFLRHNNRNYFQEVEHSLQPVQKEAVWKGVIEQESMWAYADQGSYKMTLRRTLNNIQKVREQASELKEIIKEKFSDETLFSNFCDSICEDDSATDAEIDALFQSLAEG